MKQDSTQEQLKELLMEAKKYYGYQKEFLKLSLAQQLTHILSAIAIALVSVVLALVIVMFLGLALVHLIGEAIGNIGLCYAIFALFMALILALFYHNRRKWVVLPLARLFTRTFLEEKEEADASEIGDEVAQ